MMKMNSKKIVLSAVCFSLAFGTGVLAQGNNANQNINKAAEKREEVRAEIQEKFCQRISALSSKLSQRFSDREEKIRTRREERLRKFENMQNERDERLAQVRARRDANLEEHFGKIAEQAETQEQQEAVENFQAAVKSAIQKRRQAIDSAIENFRAGVEEVHASRKTTLEGEVSEFMQAQEAALKKAEEECRNGKTPAEARQALRASLQKGKTNFSADRENLEKARLQVKNLIEVKRAATQKAIDDFKADMEKARLELQKAFPELDEEQDDEEQAGAE